MTGREFLKVRKLIRVAFERLLETGYVLLPTDERLMPDFLCAILYRAEYSCGCVKGLLRYALPVVDKELSRRVLDLDVQHDDQGSSLPLTGGIFSDLELGFEGWYGDMKMMTDMVDMRFVRLGQELRRRYADSSWKGVAP